jgi:hypothetical protein
MQQNIFQDKIIFRHIRPSKPILILIPPNMGEHLIDKIKFPHKKLCPPLIPRHEHPLVHLKDPLGLDDPTNSPRQSLHIAPSPLNLKISLVPALAVRWLLACQAVKGLGTHCCGIWVRRLVAQVQGGAWQGEQHGVGL